jgi:hypothetical protein
LITFARLPNLQQVLFWQAGIFSYTVPMILFPYTLGLILRQVNDGRAGRGVSPLLLGLTFFVPFLAGGYNEPFSALQIIFLGAVFTAGWFASSFPARRIFLSRVGLALIAATAAAVIMVSAPGNQVRQDGLAPVTEPVTILIRTIRYSYTLLRTQFFSYPNVIYLGLSVLVPFLAAFSARAAKASEANSAQNRMILLGLVLLIGLLAASIAVPMMITIRGTGYYPAARAFAVPSYFVAVSLTAWGLLAGVWLRHRWASEKTLLVLFLACAALFLLALPDSTLKLLERQLPQAQLYAAQWEARDQLLREAAEQKVKSIHVPETINYYSLRQLEPVKEKVPWVNWAMARYYQIEEIYLKE